MRTFNHEWKRIKTTPRRRSRPRPRFLNPVRGGGRERGGGRHKNPKIDSRRRTRIVRAIKIRQAKPSDAAVIAEFNARIAWETERRRLKPAVVNRGVLGLLKSPTRGTYFLAEESGAVAGQLLITYEWSDWRNGNFWWIQSVYVREGFRGRGIFRALFAHVQQLAKRRRDVCGLRLYVDVHNRTAQKTYVRLGMKKTDYELFETDFVLSH